MPTQPAILGPARLGNFRLGYIPADLAALRRTRVRVRLGGVESRASVRVGSLNIRDVLNDAPNTCSLSTQGDAPTVEQDLQITINSDDPQVLFEGTMQMVETSYEGRQSQIVYRCSAIDDIARLNRRIPYGTWTNVSATTIAQDLIATFAPDFTSNHVQSSLPTVSVAFDGSDTFSACLAKLATLIGGYFYVESLDLHLFQMEATDSPDDIDDTPGRFLNDPPITISIDTSQLRTRMYGKGASAAARVDVPAGATLIPIDTALMFNGAGGQAITGTQRLTYAATDAGGAGATVIGNQIAVPPNGFAPSGDTGGAMAVGTYWYVMTFVTSNDETPGCVVFGCTLTGGQSAVAFVAGTFWTSSDSRVIARRVYRTVVNGSSSGPFRLAATITDNTSTNFTDRLNDSGLGDSMPPTSNTTGEPTTVGSTSLRVDDLSQFLAAGGWADVSNQHIRYTGRAASSGAGNVTGVPASGSGSIVAAIPSLTPILTTPLLTGIPASGAGSIQSTIATTDQVSVWVQRDDLTAQAAMVAIDAAQGRVSDGVYEVQLVDGQRDEDALAALCDANLALYGSPIVTIKYATRDIKTKSGKTIVVDLASPPISATLTIQEVEISEIDTSPGVAPKFTVTASTVRRSLDDLLRRMSASLGGQ